MKHLNETQQRAYAYAMKPFAALSFLSGGFVIYHLLAQRRDKLQRMYHRIILAMNICVVTVAAADFVGTWAMPVGTPYRLGAAGNQTTCTTQGFVRIVFYPAVPYYYASLSIVSCVAVKNSFMEKNYRHIEKWIHLGAIIVTIPLAIFFLLCKKINPGLSGCFAEEYPLGCIDDPNVPCQRGGDVRNRNVKKIYGGVFLIITFVIPAIALLFLRASIRKASRAAIGSKGKKKMMESFRKKALKKLTAQSAFYLLSFWSTHIMNVITFIFFIITGYYQIHLHILGLCSASFQGVVLLLVYFRLEAMKIDAKTGIENGETTRDNTQIQQIDAGGTRLTVADIRVAAEAERKSVDSSLKYSFNIFDGTPDESSPWANFLNPGDDFEDEFKDDSSSCFNINEDLTLEVYDNSSS